MASYYRENGKFAKEFASMLYEKAKTDESNQRAAKRMRENSKFYKLGTEWDQLGKKLADATDIVTYYGEDMKLKDVCTFRNAFWSHARSKASKLGETGTPIDMLPLEYAGDGEFMKLYNQGVKKYGFDFGINEASLEDLPMNFRDKDSFISGYYEGRGFVLGYNGATVLDLPSDLVQNRAFFVGYEMGIEKKAKEIKESKRKR